MLPDRRTNLNRKDFIRLAAALGSTTAAASFINACSRAGILTPTAGSPIQPGPSPSIDSPTPTSIQPTESPELPKPTATEAPTNTAPSRLSQIALVKTSDRGKGVLQAIDLLGINPVQGKNVFLKPNFNSADPAPGSTHPDVLRSLVLKLREMGAGPITVGDRSGMGNTKAVMSSLGAFDLANELGFNTVIFDDLRLSEWREIIPEASHWSQGFLIATPCLDCGALVQTCCLKTHRYGGVFTLSLKNSVGMVAKYHPTTGYNYMQELHNSAHQRTMIAEINASYTPALIVLDGVEAFVSGGPDTGKKTAPGVILVGTDRVAIDAVGVAILRMFGATFSGGIYEQDQIARAIELGLGAASPQEIEFITADNESSTYAEQIRAELMKG